MERIKIIKGNITKQNVDAIVNAANNLLIGGLGVDGAIHRAAGIRLLIECIGLLGCQIGQAKLTKGYNLPAKYIIHTVGPKWHGGKKNESKILADCYINSLNVAVKNNIKTIAFPSISTGAYLYPLQNASEIAIKTVDKFLLNNTTISKVIFVCYDQHTYEIYTENFKRIYQ